MSGRPGKLRQMLAITRQFVRIGLIRKSQFRLEFVNQVLMDTIWYATQILVFEILFLETPTIAGWTASDVRVFLAYLFIGDAFGMIWLGQAWHFGRELKDGKLDPVRVRPASPIFLYFFQRFSLEGCTNMAIALGYLLYANIQVVDAPVWRVWALAPAAIAMTCWAQVVVKVLFSLWELVWLHSDMARFTEHTLDAVTERPLDIFTRRVRQFFVFALPIGAMCFVPAAWVLGRTGLVAGAAYGLWIVAFGLLVFRLWRGAFRRYESALS